MHIRSACKINLSLDVLALRPDGYHELDSVVHTVALWDELEIVPDESGFLSNADLPLDNLCTRAAARWFGAMGEDALFSTVLMRLEKQIPIGAGLGGGSGNAAAVLIALQTLQTERGGAPLNESSLHQIAAKLGADVPLFLRGGALRIQGIGEKLSDLPACNFWIVLLKPPVFGDTRAVFAAWDGAPPVSNRATEKLIEALNANSFNSIARSLGNDLADAARRCGQPVDETTKLMRDNGAREACLSGSGAACFGVFETEAEARACETNLRETLAPDWFVAAAELCEWGVETF